MGTNYDAVYNLCECCGRADRIHIGKSSAGWRFSIEVHEEVYKDWQTFEKFIEQRNIEIYDEYGRKVTAFELLSLMESKKDGQAHEGDQYRKVDHEEFADLCWYEFS